MPYMLVRHKVKDFARWKKVFDAGLPLRKASGERTFHIFRGADDPNDVTLLFEWADLEKARQFTQSTGLKLAMRQAGVAEEPAISFLLDSGRGAS